MSPKLAYLLGFPEYLRNDSAYARYSPNLHGGISSLYVYAPELIQPVIVGDTSAPLLRIVNVRGNSDETIEESYSLIQYDKLLIKEISEIKIEIRYSQGDLIPFEYGNCTLTLHFRKDPLF